MDFDVWRDPSRWVVDPVFMFFNAADRGAIRKNSMKFVEKHTWCIEILQLILDLWYSKIQKLLSLEGTNFYNEENREGSLWADILSLY